MDVNSINQKIVSYRTNKDTEDYIIEEFFDEVGEDIINLGELDRSQKEQLIISLFTFLKNQDSELDECFTFIHLIENIDKPSYEIYYKELFNFNNLNGTITSVFLLNRFINSLSGEEFNKCIHLLKSISDNVNYTASVRTGAQDYYEHQMAK